MLRIYKFYVGLKNKIIDRILKTTLIGFDILN